MLEFRPDRDAAGLRATAGPGPRVRGGHGPGAAGQVLDRARVFPTLAEAAEGITYAFATTARGRELTQKPVFTPATATPMAVEEIAQGGRGLSSLA